MKLKLIFIYLLSLSSSIYSENKNDESQSNDYVCEKMITRGGVCFSEEVFDLLFFTIKTGFECFLDNYSTIEEYHRISRENNMRDRATRSNLGNSDSSSKIKLSNDQVKEIAEKLSTSFCEKLRKYNP
jgi:hypothetical protein